MKYILTVNNGQDKSTLTEKEQQSIESTIVLQVIFFVLDHMVKLHEFTPDDHFNPSWLQSFNQSDLDNVCC
jgi:hypothetical protein